MAIEPWCILRTAGNTTLRLAASLAMDGYDVWTPTETRTVRVPKANVKREIVLPIMPSYVFARIGHLIELLQLAAMPVKPRRGAGLREPAHASFSVMHWSDRIPVVSDHHLTALRTLEAKRTPRKKADRSFPKGMDVRVNTGSFGGMTGRVERSDCATSLVCFGDKYTVKIATSLLSLNSVREDLPEYREAA